MRFKEMDLQIIESIAMIGTAIATIALVLLLYKAIKQMDSTVKLSQIQAEFQFRPWIGPSTHFQRIEPSINKKIQFEIKLKNFGELPASGVTAKFTFDSNPIKRETTINNTENTFDLGPMLPNMEKSYWFFLEPELFEKVSSGNEKLFTGVYFEYSVNKNRNGYGIISEYITSSQSFIHSDMWIDNEDSS